ncbi:9463_t:CDS:2, partial [Dentiscutata heterogama]
RVVCVKNWQTPSYMQHLVAIAPMLCIDVFSNFWICWFSLTNDKMNGIWHNDSNTNPGRPITTTLFDDSTNNDGICVFTKIRKKDKIFGMGIYCPSYPDKSIYKVVNEDYSIQESQIYTLITAIENFSIFDKPLNIFTSNKNICSI